MLSSYSVEITPGVRRIIKQRGHLACEHLLHGYIGSFYYCISIPILCRNPGMLAVLLIESVNSLKFCLVEAWQLCQNGL